MKENFNVKTNPRTATPRSKRMREAGVSASASSSPGSSSGGGDSSGVDSPIDIHTHDNKKALDAISIDNLFYLWLRQKLDGDSESQLQKVKAGYADHAGDAEFADEAGNAVLWDEHEFADWLDQPVKKGDIVQFARVIAGMLKSPNFVSGPLGAGWQIAEGDNGESYAEVDHLSVRKTMKIYELIIQQLKHQGGIVFYTAASLKISKVEDVEGGYKCYFDTEDGHIPNEFEVNDQARCQRFRLGKTLNKYYWRLVTAVGEDYVILSSSDCDNNSDIPAEGDVLVQLGSRSNVQRQTAKVTTTIGNDSPRDDYYQGINSYDLTGKLVATVGVRNGHVGIWTDEGSFSGVVTIAPGSQGLDNLSEWNGFVSGLEKELENLQDQIDGAIDTWYYEGVPTLNNEPAQKWLTIDDRNKHLGDLYYNKTDGKAYRFMYDDGQYKWALIEDTDITRALAAAAAAQDTADHKRRVFVAKPTDGDAYDVGDMWVNATFGQYSNVILRCVKAKISGEAFNINHWTKADGYTDDSALHDFIGGQYSEDLDEIRTQVDGKSETWYQETDPSASWSTIALKEEHAGDMWYNTAPDESGHCHAYIYRKKGDNFGWEEINGVPKEVFDMADGKASVYISKPESYKSNDLWIIEAGLSSSDMPFACTAGDIVVATATSSAYDRGHWKKKVKYTDDSSMGNFISNKYGQYVNEIIDQEDVKAETWYRDSDPSILWQPFDKAMHVGDIWCDKGKNNAMMVYTSAYVWDEMGDVPQEIKETIEREANIYASAPIETPNDGDLLIPAVNFSLEGVEYCSGHIYRYKAYHFEEIGYASNSDLAITVIEKEVWRKALQEINPSKTSSVSVLKAGITDITTIEGEAWEKEDDQRDDNYGWYVSNCHEDGERSIVTIKVFCYIKCDMAVHLMSRAESSYDYTVLGPLDGEITWQTESRNEKTYYTPTNAVESTLGKQGEDCQHTFQLKPGIHTFQIAYRKDYSATEEPDNGYFRVEDVINDGTLAGWCSLCDRSGDKERKAAAISAANALFSYMNETLHVWSNVTTYMASDSFRDTMRSLFAAYYVSISKIETGVIGSDLNFLKAVFSKATTKITGGVVDTAAVVSKMAVVTDEDNNVVAGLNGTRTMGFDPTHKKLMLFAGANGLPNVAKSKFRVYEDGHVVASDMEMEGKVEAGSGNIGGFEIGQNSLISGTRGAGPAMELYRTLLRFSTNSLGESDSGEGEVSLGSNVVPGAAGGSAGCFRVTLNNPGSYPGAGENFGVYADVKGGNMDNYAFYAPNGVIGGLRPKTYLISGNVTLKKTWYHLLLFNSGYTITLPSNPEVGQTYELLVVNGSKFTLNGGGNRIWCTHNGESGSSMALGGTRECWRILYANDQWIAFPYHN